MVLTAARPAPQLDNVLLHNGFTAGQPAQVKLCDFGYSKSMGSNCITACGTPEYMAPEVRAPPHNETPPSKCQIHI